jgi:dienelactone hydrolase
MGVDRRSVILGGLGGALGCATSSEAAVRSFSDHIAALSPAFEVRLPEGEGPFPVVLQFHGCGGVKKLQGRWADVVTEAGWAAVIVDSYAHRGISYVEALTQVCPGLRLWGRERAGDVFAAVAWAKEQAWADASRIVLAGWSHGGWTVLDALALHPGDQVQRAAKLSGLPEEPLAGVVGAFVVYPYAGVGSVAAEQGLRLDVGTRAIVGSRDVIVGSKALRKRLEAMRTPGAPVDVVWFEGATHAFDEPEARDMRVAFSPELTARAHRMLREYLHAR